jgi:hypothetical protein
MCIACLSNVQPFIQYRQPPKVEEVKGDSKIEIYHRLGNDLASSQKDAGNKRGTNLRSDKPTKWGAAQYKGFTIGKATRRDMIRNLGKPDRVEIPSGKGTSQEILYHYNVAGDFVGELVVIVNRKNKIVKEIIIYPSKMTKDDAIKQFGDNYRLTQYEFDECLSDGESVPIYESPNGQLKYIEYREKGIAIAIDYKDVVTDIRYVMQPIGYEKSKCIGFTKKRKSKTTNLKPKKDR